MASGSPRQVHTSGKGFLVGNRASAFIMLSDSVVRVQTGHRKDRLILLRNLGGLRHEAGSWYCLKALSLTHLVADAGCQLGDLSPSPWSLRMG